MCEDSKCANVNYPRRTECNKCGKKRGPLGDAVVKAYIDTMRMQRGEGVHGSAYFPSEEWWMGSMNSPSPGGQFATENGYSGGHLGEYAGQRKHLSAVQEGKRLAEQLVGLFASTSDPIGDAGECLASAALYLQKMKNRLIQIPSPLDRPLSAPPKPKPTFLSSSSTSSPFQSSFVTPSPSHSSSLYSSHISSPYSSPFSSLRLRAFATAGGRGLGNGSASSFMNSNSSFGGFSEDVAWPNPVNGNAEKSSLLSPNASDNGTYSNSTGSTSNGGSTLNLGGSSSVAGGNHLGGSNYEGAAENGGKVADGNGFAASYDGLSSFENLSCSSGPIGYSARIQSPVTSPPPIGRIMIPRPLVKFEDYKDRPSEYLREFGDPAAMNMGGGSMSQRPEAGVDGNWECEDCKNVNFPRRTNCFQCHKKRGGKGEDVVREYVRRLIEGV